MSNKYRLDIDYLCYRLEVSRLFECFLKQRFGEDKYTDLCDEFAEWGVTKMAKAEGMTDDQIDTIKELMAKDRRSGLS